MEPSTEKMDQSMIDALLAEAGNAEADLKENSLESLLEEENIIDFSEDLNAEFKDQFATFDESEFEVIPEQQENEEYTQPLVFETPVELEADLMEEIPQESAWDANEMSSSSMLAQLMAEMQDESLDMGVDSFPEDDFMQEDSIESLLNAAQNSSDKMGDSSISLGLEDDSEISEIEALLGMSDNGEVLDENMELLRMIEEASEGLPESLEEELDEAIREVNEADLEAILSVDGGDAGTKDKKKKVPKEKKPFNFKEFMSKIFLALMEEVPDDEEVKKTSEMKLSDENEQVLNELDQETEQKVKVKGKKEKKEKDDKKKQEKKEKKELKKNEKKAKNDKKKQEKNEKKEQKARARLASATSEKKIPRKKKLVTFIFGFSLLALILLVENFVLPILTQSRARSAYDKGEYYEAYKEYYGQKLSEEDEKRFQGATTILRMQSNLDGYHNYVKMNKEVYALHSLLDGVKVKFEVYLKAEEFGVLTQVMDIYNEILEILNSKYYLSEDDALNLVNEKSDAVYTRKLEALVEGKSYIEDSSDSIDQSDLLPEEKELFQN